MKKYVSAFVTILLFATLFAGCGAQDPFVGEWHAVGYYLAETDTYAAMDNIDEDIVFTFDSDHNIYIGNEKLTTKVGTWKLRGNTYYLTFMESISTNIGEGYIKDEKFYYDYATFPGTEEGSIEKEFAYAVFEKE